MIRPIVDKQQYGFCSDGSSYYLSLPGDRRTKLPIAEALVFTPCSGSARWRKPCCVRE